MYISESNTYSLAQVTQVAALAEAQAFDGTALRAEQVLQATITYEAVFNTLTTQQQTTLHSIDAILDIAIQTLKEQIRAMQQGTASSIAAVFTKRDEVLLPPGSGSLQAGDGTGEFKAPEFTPRLERLLVHLQEIGIYTDDVLITEGTLYEGQMRQVPYRLVEIPCLQADILVCDQVGEATFVSQVMRGFSYYAHHNKEQLLEQDGIVKVVDVNNDEWWANIVTVLQAQELYKKIDVQQYADIRSAIQAMYTAEEYVQMSVEKRKKIHCGHLGIKAIGSIFGIKDDFHAAMPQLQLGLRIYNSHPFIQAEIDRYNPEKLAAELRSQRTAEEYVQMSISQRRKIHCGQFKLTAIGRILGIEGDLLATLPQLQLGLRIYNSHPSIQAEIDRYNPEKLAAELRSQRTAEEYLKMNTTKRSKIHCGQFGLVAIGSIFGIEGNLQVNLPQLQLGLRIYNQDARIQAEIDRYDPEKLAAELRTQRNIEQYLTMSRIERNKIQCGQLGIVAIGTILGVEGDLNSILPQLILGLQIYNQDDRIQAEIDRYDPEKLAAELRTQRNTEKYLAMSTIERHKIQCGQLGFIAISTILGVKESLHRRISQLELGLKIYGNHPLLLQAIAAEVAKKASPS